MRENTKTLATPISGLLSIILDMSLLFFSLILPVAVITWFFRLSHILLYVSGIVLGLLSFYASFIIVVKIIKVFIPHPKEGTYPLDSKEAALWGLNLLIANSQIFKLLRDAFHVSYFLARLYYSSFGLKLKPYVHLAAGVKIVDPYLIEIEDGVIFGESSVVFSHAIENGQLILKKVVIKKGALIGTESTIFPGALIGENVILGAKSLVLKDTVIPAGEVWAGVPARKIR